MVEIIRWLRGYVKIKVWGYSPERFMNLCTNRGILLWGLAGYGAYYTMCLSLSDFFAIRDIVRKTKTRVAVLERCGLPFFMRDVRRRKMFAVGVFLCLAFLLFMSRFIWAIDFEGNYQITDEMLMNFLASEGIGYGTKKSALNLEELEGKLRQTFSQVTWTSARLEGTKITVSIRENDLPTQEEAADAARRLQEGASLVAARDGVVEEILTRSGVPQVKAGDEVEKGDVLISGLIPVTNDDGTVRGWQTCVADGDVWIRYERPVELTQQLAYQYKNYTGREKKISFFTLGQKRYLLSPGKCSFSCYDEVVEQEQLQLFSQIDLPLWTGTIRCREYLPVDAVYDEDSAREKLEGTFLKIVAGLEEKGVQIVQKDVTIIRKTNALSMTGSVTVLEKAVLLERAEPEAESGGEDGGT